MGNEFKDFEMETPSLTLEPDLESLKRKKK
mgnify:FL=1